MENAQIKEIVEGILTKMSVDIESIEEQDNGFNTTFQVHTPDAAMLIGNRGETLEALSYIIRRMVQQELEGTEQKAVFIVDVNNYQTKKLDEFRKSIKTSADRVRLFKEPVELSPMTSYERMIVHATFTDDDDIKTESEGDGKFRHIVLKHVSTTPTETTNEDKEE